MKEITKQDKVCLLRKIAKSKAGLDLWTLAAFYGVQRDQGGNIRDSWKHQIADRIKSALSEMQSCNWVNFENSANNITNIKVTAKGQFQIFYHRAGKILYFFLFTVPVAVGAWLTIIKGLCNG